MHLAKSQYCPVLEYNKNKFDEVHLVPPLLIRVAPADIHCLVWWRVKVDPPHAVGDCSKGPDTECT